jgi:tripartite-type tricarboxylate transporter receptor subunit TctC
MVRVEAMGANIIMRNSRRALLRSAAVALAAPLAFPAIVRAKEAWPARPIRCIVPLPPGGGTDAIGRGAMQRLSEALGFPVVVDNKAGAGGTIGSEIVAQAAPDGYTLGIATASSHAAAPVFRKDLPYDPVKSFTAITLLGTTPYILVGGPAAGARDLPGFIANTRTQPGKVACASLGASTLGYLLTRQLELIAGLEMIDAPYKGSAQAYPDLMNGTVAVMLDNPSGSAGLVRDGRLTGFAVTRPSPVLPDVPTFESFGVKNFDGVFWYGVVAPAGLSPEIAERIQQALAEGFLADPGRAALRALDVEPVMSTPDSFAKTMAQETRDLGALAQRLGVKPE